MQNKKSIILIFGIILVAGLIGFYVYSKIQKNDGSTPITIKDFLPFGIGSTEENTQIANGTDDNSNIIITEDGQIVAVNKLKKLADFAVSGAVFFEDHRPVTKKPNPVTSPQPSPSKGEGELGSRSEEARLNDEVGQGATPTNVGVGGGDSNVAEPDTVATPDLTFEVVPAIKYIERSNGHIYQKYLDNDVEGKISNSTISTIYEAIFSGNTNSVIYRYLASDRKTVSSYLGTLGASVGEFLPENISDVAVSPDGSKFFYLAPSSGGVAGTIRSFGDIKKYQIFTSSFSEWVPQWANSQTIYLTTKASSSVLGYVYGLNTANGSFNKVFGGVSGLTTLGSPDGSMLLYSSSTRSTSSGQANSGPRLAIFNIKSRSNTNLELYGLPEKCVWTKDSSAIYCGIPNSVSQNEPDSWYQGLTSFDDSFVKIDASSGAYFNINTYMGESIDATKLFLGNSERTLFFTNKKDSTLWSLEVR